ncbi:mechanosensitive ion channel family protein [Alcaligenes sp. Marseille-Q7550]
MEEHSLYQRVAAVLEQWGDVLAVFMIILFALLAGMVASRVMARLAQRTDPTRHVWVHGFLAGASGPLKTLIWVLGLAGAARLLVEHDVSSMLAAVLPTAPMVAVIAVVTWYFLKVCTQVQENLVARARARRHELDPTATDAIGKLVRASIVLTAALTVMQALGYAIAGVLAFGGVGGVAIGFAAQSLVANLLGGLTIFASRPFKVGEYIIIPGTELAGGVEHIGWRATRLIGFDCKPFYVPNSMFNTQPIINHSRMTARRIMETLHPRYMDMGVMSRIVEECRQMLREHKGIQQDFFAFNFDSCGERSLQLSLYAFTVSTDYNEFMNVKEDILLRIADIVRRHGAQLAEPVATVYAPDGLFEAMPAPRQPAPV